MAGTEPAPKKTPEPWPDRLERWARAIWGELCRIVGLVAARSAGWKTPSLGTLVLILVGAWFVFGRGTSIFGAAEGGGPASPNASEGLVLVVQALMAAQGMALGSRINRYAGQGGFGPPPGQYPSQRPPYQPPPYQGGDAWRQ